MSDIFPQPVRQGKFFASCEIKYLKSRLNNTPLLQLVHYILRQCSVPPVLPCSPCCLFPIQPSFIRIHETVRSRCEFPHHRQRNTGQGSKGIGFKVFFLRGRQVGPVYTFCSAPTLFNEIQFAVEFWQKNDMDSTSLAACFEQ